ncbi:hypothetical protein [Scytonema sp. UIC 10036]|uniref:hypothetical protein n=1 Tax=Scytonema sp. UIC 10036 TaxID=2304196 RepID=UPI001A9B30C3|nr:hypothetical protein [Scytonema sp. UIC 10036]
MNEIAPENEKPLLSKGDKLIVPTGIVNPHNVFLKIPRTAIASFVGFSEYRRFGKNAQKHFIESV